MSLIYSLVARGGTVLAEFTDSSGNFTTVTQNVLDKIPNEDQKCTYVYDKYLFHYIREDGIVYLCLADEAFGRRVPFAFLNQIKRDFIPFKSGSKNAIAYSYNTDFSPTLKRQMAAFSRGSADPLAQARGEVDAVKNVMVHNIDKVLKRGEHLDILVDKAEGLEMEAHRFQKNARKLKNKMWWQNQKFCLLIFVVVAVLALIIGLSVSKKKKH